MGLYRHDATLVFADGSAPLIPCLSVRVQLHGDARLQRPIVHLAHYPRQHPPAANLGYRPAAVLRGVPSERHRRELDGRLVDAARRHRALALGHRCLCGAGNSAARVPAAAAHALQGVAGSVQCSHSTASVQYRLKVDIATFGDGTRQLSQLRQNQSIQINRL